MAVPRKQGCEGSEAQPTPGPLILVLSRVGINKPIFQMGKVGALRGEEWNAGGPLTLQASIQQQSQSLCLQGALRNSHNSSAIPETDKRKLWPARADFLGKPRNALPWRSRSSHLPKDGTGLLGPHQRAFPGLPQSREPCREQCRCARCFWPSGGRGECAQKCPGLRGSPSQSPGSALWLEWAKGLPAQGKAEARPVTGRPSYLSMTTAAHMKCILCARHMDSAVLTAVSQPLLLPSQVLGVEAEASQTCLRPQRLALPCPFKVGEMTWAPACPEESRRVHLTHHPAPTPQTPANTAC